VIIRDKIKLCYLLSFRLESFILLYFHSSLIEVFIELRFLFKLLKIS